MMPSKVIEPRNNKYDDDFHILYFASPYRRIVAAQLTLNEFEYNTQSARTIMEASQVLQGERVDLMIIDLQEIETDVFGFLKIIRDRPVTSRPKVLLVGCTEQNLAITKELLHQGADDFLSSEDWDLIKHKVDNLYNEFLQLKKLETKSERTDSEIASLRLKAKSLEDSIRYAKLIQDGVLQNPDKLSKQYGHNFVIHQPKDSIGGDFYMVIEANNRLISVCSDCTGHGVPGALLAMIGYEFISDIIHNKRIFDPGAILTELNNKVNRFFSKQSAIPTQGMDVSIVTYVKDTGETLYGSAKGLVVLSDHHETLFLKGDPVSIGDDMARRYEFRTYRIENKKRFWIYQFSDGMPDQFGGPRNKKMGKKGVGALLSLQVGDAEKQCTMLRHAINTWKGKLPQTDDITLMGRYIDH